MKYIPCFYIALLLSPQFSRAQLIDDSLLSICRSTERKSFDTRHHYANRSTKECFKGYFRSIRIFENSYDEVEGNDKDKNYWLISPHYVIRNFLSLNRYTGEPTSILSLDSFNVEILKPVSNLYQAYLYLLVNHKLDGCFVGPNSYLFRSKNEEFNDLLGSEFNNCGLFLLKDARVVSYIDNSSFDNINIVVSENGKTNVYNFKFGKKHRIKSFVLVESF